ncbi:hypothetical protein C0Q70_14676 [Pomacea canaliculata]|uniref:Uncharacterized protein n=1 Tax=Pomacea canaliculata TaxID=400727 RepID=A0A2T7NSS5_POMCA|nr:hypothetical protein C0Q70_14676 [Pomacea canaliculata]
MRSGRQDPESKSESTMERFPRVYDHRAQHRPRAHCVFDLGRLGNRELPALVQKEAAAVGTTGPAPWETLPVSKPHCNYTAVGPRADHVTNYQPPSPG